MCMCVYICVYMWRGSRQYSVFHYLPFFLAMSHARPTRGTIQPRTRSIYLSIHRSIHAYIHIPPPPLHLLPVCPRIGLQVGVQLRRRVEALHVRGLEERLNSSWGRRGSAFNSASCVGMRSFSTAGAGTTEWDTFAGRVGRTLRRRMLHSEYPIGTAAIQCINCT